QRFAHLQWLAPRAPLLCLTAPPNSRRESRISPPAEEQHRRYPLSPRCTKTTPNRIRVISTLGQPLSLASASTVSRRSASTRSSSLKPTRARCRSYGRDSRRRVPP